MSRCKRLRCLIWAFGLLVLLWILSIPAWALGPYQAQVIRVIDGDTLVAKIEVWIGQSVEATVRIAGVDTPELDGKACERQASKDARLFVTQRVNDGIELSDISTDKYGRILATVKVRGLDLGLQLIQAGLGKPYFGDRKVPWCQP